MTSLFLLVPAYVAAAGLVAFSFEWLLTIGWRRAASAHWAERARLLWPARKFAANSILLLPGLAGVVQYFLDDQFSFRCVIAAAAG